VKNKSKDQFGLPDDGERGTEKSKRSAAKVRVRLSKYSSGLRPPLNISRSEATLLNSAARKSSERVKSSPAIRSVPSHSMMRPDPLNVNPDPPKAPNNSVRGDEDTCTSAELVFQLIRSASPSFSCREIMFLMATQDGICRAVYSSALRDFDYKRPLRALLGTLSKPL